MKSIYYYMLAGLTLSTSGCSSWLSEDDAPVMSYDYYETEAGVNAAITAAYGFLRWGVGGERFNVLTELGTDLFTEGEDGSNRESYNKYATQLNPDDGILYEMWENHYKGISDANIAMQKILDSQDLLESVKTQSYAEMQFIRAYLYFDLVQQFGRIPLVTEGSSRFGRISSVLRLQIFIMSSSVICVMLPKIYRRRLRFWDVPHGIQLPIC